MFNLFKFVLRRARQHWQLLFTLSAGVMLASALLASGPLLVDRLIETGLRLTIQGSSLLDGNLLLTTSVPASKPGFQQLDQGIKTTVGQTLGQHQKQVTASAKSPWLYPWAGGQLSTSQRVNLAYYENIQEHADVLTGSWPTEPSSEPGVLRAVVGEAMAQAFALHAGERLALSPNTAANAPQLWLEVTGIVRPHNPHDPYWSGELGPFASMQTSYGTTQYQAIVPLDTLFTEARTLFPDSNLELNWYVALDPQTFRAADIEPFQTQLARLTAQLAILQPPVKLETGIPEILKKFQAQFETVRLPVYILIAEILFLVLYYVSMVAELFTRQMEREFATMYSRGISTRQIARAHLLEILVILAITFALGPWLGAGLVRILSWVGPLSNLAQPGGAFNPSRMVWIATGMGTLACLASLVIPLGPALRRSIVAYQQILTRDTRPPWWQRYYLDVFVLGIGLVLIWRLNQYGEMLVSEPGGAQLDWLLLLSPLALSVGAATLFLRAFPFFLEILASLAARGRGLLGALALWQSARNPAHVSRLVLLLSLAVSLGILSTGLNLTLDQSESDRASYMAGKDLRLSTSGAVPLSEMQSMPGVKQLSAVWTGKGTLSSGSSASSFDLMAIEPGSFSTVTNFRMDFADQDMGSLLANLSIRKGGNPSLLPLPGQPGRFGIWLWAELDNKAEMDSYNRWIDGDSDVERVGVTAKFQTAQGELFTTQLKRTDANGGNGPTVKHFSLKTTLDGRDFNLGIHIRPDNGGWYYFDSALPELPPSSFPLSLQSLWFQNQATRLGKPIAKAISLVTDDFTVVDAVTQKTQIVEDFESLNRTVFLITMYGSHYVGIFSNVTDRAAHSGIWGQSITMNYAPPMQTYPLRLRRTWTQEPLPALASSAFLDTTKTKIGDVVHASINDVGINFRIAGALHYFPTMYNQSPNGYLVTSRDLLLPILNNQQVAPINPNEVFLDSGGNLSPDNLLAIMPLNSQGWSAAKVRKTFMANPLALGLRSVAFFGFMLTSLLSLLGFSTHFYMSIRMRETLYGVMRALGISARQLYFWMVLEQAILILTSLILGTALGYLLNQITLPRLPVTLGDAQSIPPFVAQTDWLAIGQLYLGLLLAFLMVIALISAFVWRANLGRILRMGEES